MRLRLVSTGLLALIAASCGGELEVPVDVARPLTTLSDEEAVEVCEVVHRQLRDRYTRQQICASRFIAEARQPNEVPQFSTPVCERFDACKDDPPDPAPRICTLPCLVHAPSCTATVEEWVACLEVANERARERLDRYVCDEAIPESMGGTPECTVLSNRCRDPQSSIPLELTAECVQRQVVVD